MNEKNLVKRYFLFVQEPLLPTVVAALVAALYVVIYTIVLPWETGRFGQMGIVLAVAMATWVTHIAVGIRYITRTSDFPDRTHLLWKDPAGHVHAGTAFWAKQNVEAVTIPTIIDNVFHTTVRLDRSKEYRAPAHPKGVDVELFFMLRDRPGPLPYGFDPDELYSRMCYRDNQHDVGQWLAGIFQAVVFTEQSVLNLFEEWDTHDMPGIVVFQKLMEALRVLEQKHIMPRQSSNIWTMTAIVKVPQDVDVVRFDLDKSHLPGDKPSAEN